MRKPALYESNQTIKTHLAGKINQNQTINMKCINHIANDAVGACSKCGAGLCVECFKTSATIDGKPLCAKCARSLAEKNTETIKSELVGKWVKFVFLAASFIAGVILGICTHHKFQSDLHSSSSADSGNAMLLIIVAPLLFWGIGTIGTTFKILFQPRSVQDQVDEGVSDAISRYDGDGGLVYLFLKLLFKLIGFVLLYLIVAVTNPIQIIMTYFKIRDLREELATYEPTINAKS